MKNLFAYLFVFSLLCCSLKVGAVSAKSAVVINGDTGEVLYSLDKDVRMPMASTTKIMTALILCEYGNLSKEITVSKEMVMVEGTSMGLLEGDKVTLKDLLYGMMLCSGNDAANAIALTVGGSFEGFAEMMNAKVKELKLKNTNFVTPSGLDADNHYTSAYDLAVIAKEAFGYEEFEKAVSSVSSTLMFGNPPYKRTLTNHNKLLKMYDDVVGIKTGYTKKSGRCLVSASKKDEKFIIAVTLNDKDDWADHRELLDIGLSAVDIKKTDSFSKKIDLVNAENESLEVSSPDISVCVSVDAKIKCVTYLPSFLYAPINKNETIGYRVLFSNETEIERVELKATEKQARKNPTNFERLYQNLFCIIRSLNEG